MRSSETGARQQSPAQHQTAPAEEGRHAGQTCQDTAIGETLHPCHARVGFVGTGADKCCNGHTRKRQAQVGRWQGLGPGYSGPDSACVRGRIGQRSAARGLRLCVGAQGSGLRCCAPGRRKAAGEDPGQCDAGRGTYGWRMRRPGKRPPYRRKTQGFCGEPETTYALTYKAGAQLAPTPQGAPLQKGTCGGRPRSARR